MMMTSFERIKTYALHARRKLRTTYFVILGFTAIIIFYLTATAYAQSTTSFALPWFTVSNGGGSSSGGSYELYDSINQSGLGEMKGGAFAISDGFQVTSTPTPTSTRTENPERPTPTPTNTPTTGPKLELAKSVSQNVAQANDLLTYQVVVTATHDTAMIELSDVLTNGLTYVENSVSENARVEHDTIRYTGSVLPDNPLTIHYQARVAADIEPGRTLNNRVVVTNTSNNQRLDDTVIVSVPSTPTISSLVLLYVNADNIAGGPADLSWHIRQLIRRVHRGAAALGDADASVEIFMVLDWYGDRNSRLFHVSKESNGNCDLFTDFGS